MTLTPRQQLTLDHLKQQGITKPLDIIKYCLEKINKPRRSNLKSQYYSNNQLRRRSKQYYQDIINYLAQQSNKTKSLS